MNHPTPEDWALYVSDEVSPKERSGLAEHLHGCGSCAADVAALQRSANRLSAWKFPMSSRGSFLHARAVIQWAMAAAVLLAAGFALGQAFNRPRHEVAKLRAEIETGMKVSLRGEWQRTAEEQQARFNQALATTEAHLATNAEEQLNRAVRNLAAALNSVREQDQRNLRLLLEAMQQRHDNEMRWLRTDLETLASHADDQLRLAQLRFRQLNAGTDK